MTLAVLGRRLCEPLTGVGRYLEAMLRHWPDIPSPFTRIRVLAPGKPQVDQSIWREPLELVQTRSMLPPLVWENTVAAWQSRHAALVFSPYTLPVTLAGRGVVSNLGIYEGLPGEFSVSQRLRTTPFFRHATRHARRVIANSQSTKSDCVRHLSADPANVEVVYPGVGPEFQPDPAGRETTNPYFLFVGKLSRRRNVPALIKAFAEYVRHRPKWRLVIAGPDTSGVEVPRLASEQGIAAAVQYHPYVHRATLVPLYQRASAFVLPSAHEGFSFTILEAMACGLPVITVNHASLEAGVREACFLTHPGPAALESAMCSVGSATGAYDTYRQLSLSRAEQFSWRKSAEQTMQILVRAAQSR